MAILARDVRRAYGDVVAVDRVTLEVEEGEVYALVGPNGAGKTTLVRALTGTTDATGRIELLGHSPDAVPRDRIGLLPQAFSPPDRLTARELLQYYGGLYDHARQPEAVLADVGLDALDVRYDRLSGGQQRRVCLATALVNEPDLLFLDEPTTGIDPAGRRALLSLLETLVGEGTTIFLTSHYMREVERLADRVGLLAHGRLVAEGSPTDLVDAHGGAARLEVETDPDATAVLREAGYTVEPDGQTVTVMDVTPTDVGAIARALESAGLGYDRLTWREPDLEDVYLALVEAGSNGVPEQVTRDGMEPAEGAESA